MGTVTEGTACMYHFDGEAGEPVYVRLNDDILENVQRTTAHLQAQAPFANITRSDALRHLIRCGVEASQIAS